MPKIDAEGRPSYAGQEGLVTNAVGEVHQVDPSRNVDGSRVDGYESEDRTVEDRDDTDAPVGGSTEISATETDEQREQREAAEQAEEQDDTAGEQGGGQSANGGAAPVKKAAAPKTNNSTTTTKK